MQVYWDAVLQQEAREVTMGWEREERGKREKVHAASGID
jgi:hypothetical protein